MLNAISRGALVLSGLLLTGAGPAAAQDPPPPEDIAEFTFTPLDGPPGTVVTVTGRCVFRSGQPADRASVRLVADPPSSSDFSVGGETEVGPDGSVTGSLTVPADTAPGAYLLSASCFLTDFAFGERTTVPFTVTGPAPTSTPPSSTATSVLARTGSSASGSNAPLVGSALVAAGTGALIMSRRRTARSRP